MHVFEVFLKEKTNNLDQLWKELNLETKQSKIKLLFSQFYCKKFNIFDFWNRNFQARKLPRKKVEVRKFAAQSARGWNLPRILGLVNTIGRSWPKLSIDAGVAQKVPDVCTHKIVVVGVGVR